MRHRSRAYWQERALRSGEEVGTFIEEVFDADDVLSQLRTVQAIVTHLEKYPVERLEPPAGVRLSMASRPTKA